MPPYSTPGNGPFASPTGSSRLQDMFIGKTAATKRKFDQVGQEQRQEPPRRLCSPPATSTARNDLPATIDAGAVGRTFSRQGTITHQAKSPPALAQHDTQSDARRITTQSRESYRLQANLESAPRSQSLPQQNAFYSTTTNSNVRAIEQSSKPVIARTQHISSTSVTAHHIVIDLTDDNEPAPLLQPPIEPPRKKIKLLPPSSTRQSFASAHHTTIPSTGSSKNSDRCVRCDDYSTFLRKEIKFRCASCPGRWHKMCGESKSQQEREARREAGFPLSPGEQDWICSECWRQKQKVERASLSSAAATRAFDTIQTGSYDSDPIQVSTPRREPSATAGRAALSGTSQLYSTQARSVVSTASNKTSPFRHSALAESQTRHISEVAASKETPNAAVVTPPRALSVADRYIYNQQTGSQNRSIDVAELTTEQTPPPSVSHKAGQSPDRSQEDAHEAYGTNNVPRSSAHEQIQTASQEIAATTHGSAQLDRHRASATGSRIDNNSIMEPTIVSALSNETVSPDLCMAKEQTSSTSVLAALREKKHRELGVLASESRTTSVDAVLQTSPLLAAAEDFSTTTCRDVRQGELEVADALPHTLLTATEQPPASTPPSAVRTHQQQSPPHSEHSSITARWQRPRGSLAQVERLLDISEDSDDEPIGSSRQVHSTPSNQRKIWRPRSSSDAADDDRHTQSSPVKALDDAAIPCRLGASPTHKLTPLPSQGQPPASPPKFALDGADTDDGDFSSSKAAIINAASDPPTEPPERETRHSSPMSAVEYEQLRGLSKGSVASEKTSDNSRGETVRLEVHAVLTPIQVSQPSTEERTVGQSSHALPADISDNLADSQTFQTATQQQPEHLQNLAASNANLAPDKNARLHLPSQSAVVVASGISEPVTVLPSIRPSTSDMSISPNKRKAAELDDTSASDSEPEHEATDTSRTSSTFATSTSTPAAEESSIHEQQDQDLETMPLSQAALAYRNAALTTRSDKPKSKKSKIVRLPVDTAKLAAYEDCRQKHRKCTHKEPINKDQLATDVVENLSTQDESIGTAKLAAYEECRQKHRKCTHKELVKKDESTKDVGEQAYDEDEPLIDNALRKTSLHFTAGPWMLDDDEPLIKAARRKQSTPKPPEAQSLDEDEPPIETYRRTSSSVSVHALSMSRVPVISSSQPPRAEISQTTALSMLDRALGGFMKSTGVKRVPLSQDIFRPCHKCGKQIPPDVGALHRVCKSCQLDQQTARSTERDEVTDIADVTTALDSLSSHFRQQTPVARTPSNTGKRLTPRKVSQSPARAVTTSPRITARPYTPLRTLHEGRSPAQAITHIGTGTAIMVPRTVEICGNLQPDDLMDVDEEMVAPDIKLGAGNGSAIKALSAPALEATSPSSQHIIAKQRVQPIDYDVVQKYMDAYSQPREGLQTLRMDETADIALQTTSIDKAAKLAEIKARKTRKQNFGQPASVSRLPIEAFNHTLQLEGGDSTTIRVASPSPYTAAGFAGFTTSEQEEDIPLQVVDNVADLFGAPKSVVMLMHGSELVWREAPKAGEGARTRAKQYFKIGKGT